MKVIFQWYPSPLNLSLLAPPHSVVYWEYQIKLSLNYGTFVTCSHRYVDVP